MGRIRQLMFILLCAAAGAVAGRLLGALRRRNSDEEPFDAADGLAGALRIGPRELVPGLVAAMRAGEPPWSFLRIPSWLAAFGVNFAFGALGSELQPLVQRFFGRSDLSSTAGWETPAPSPQDEVVESEATATVGAPVEPEVVPELTSVEG